MQPIPALDNKARHVYRQARLAIQESRNYIGFMVIDNNGRISLCSNRAARVFGCDPTTLEGARLAEHVFDTGNNGISAAYFSQNKSSFGYKSGWHPLNAMTTDSRRIPVEGSIVNFTIGNASMTLLHLRHQDAA